MDNYNNLVLMKKDPESGFLIDTLDSFEVFKNIEYVDRIYADEEDGRDFIYLRLTTMEIDEDSLYYSIFDLYNMDIFDDIVNEIEEMPGDSDPKWVLKFEYSGEHEKTEKLINEIISIHTAELERIMPLTDEKGK